VNGLIAGVWEATLSSIGISRIKDNPQIDIASSGFSILMAAPSRATLASHMLFRSCIFDGDGDSTQIMKSALLVRLAFWPDLHTIPDDQSDPWPRN
jgi:hypothetical protein